MRSLNWLLIATSTLLLMTVSYVWLGGTSMETSDDVITSEVSGAGNVVHARCVRAEYFRRTGGLDGIDTELLIVNRSLTRTFKLKSIVVVGAGGASNVLSVYNGLVDKVVPPLGEIVLPIDSSLPGVFARTDATRRPRDVASVVVTWEGPGDAMRLTASHFRWERRNSTEGYGATTIEESYPLAY